MDWFIWINCCLTGKTSKGAKNCFVIMFTLVKIFPFAEQKEKLVPRDFWPFDIYRILDSSLPMKSSFGQRDFVAFVGWKNRLSGPSGLEVKFTGSSQSWVMLLAPSLLSTVSPAKKGTDIRWNLPSWIKQSDLGVSLQHINIHAS